MAHPVPGSRFQEDNYHVYHISEERLELVGGGDFYSGDTSVVDEDTWKTARELAAKYGMVIVEGHGTWEGWSEYTPDPGDVSVFTWHKAP